jgi:curved DNA-binding protein CbpA
VQPGRRLVVTARARPVQQSPDERAPAEADAGGADPVEAKREAPAPAKPREERPRSTPKPSSSRRPRAQPSDPALSAQLVEAKLASLEDASHYEVLALSLDASAGQIAAAFPALARRWHPDRLRPDQAGLRDAVTRIFSRMTEASAVLSHVDSRQHYDQSLANALREDEEQEQVSRVLRAAEAFQKAEILIRKRDMAGAEQLARMAFEGDPDQPEYAALFAFVRSRRDGCSDDERKQLLATLKDALGRQSHNVRIRYYYACVLKAAGQADKALRELRVVAEQDPSNLEAKRELRLYDMRRKNGPSAAAAAGSGLFGRIFKR